MKTVTIMVFLAICLMPAFSQPPGGGGGGRRQMTEEQVTEGVRRTADSLNLTDAQEKKVLEFELEFYKERQKMFENFLWYLRSELRIDTSKPPDKLITEAAIKSGTKENDVKAIFELWNKIAEWKSAKSKVFLEFYNKIDTFYNKGNFK